MEKEIVLVSERVLPLRLSPSYKITGLGVGRVGATNQFTLVFTVVGPSGLSFLGFQPRKTDVKHKSSSLCQSHNKLD